MVAISVLLYPISNKNGNVKLPTKASASLNSTIKNKIEIQFFLEEKFLSGRIINLMNQILK